MAGEKKGVTCEALIKVALDRLIEVGALDSPLFWNVKPEGISIIPDLTVGRSPDEPSVIILITHATASKKSTMKLWRNVGELLEAKTQLRTCPAVYNIVFDAVAYDALKVLQQFIFDGQLIIGDLEYGPAVQAWVDQNTGLLSRDREQRAGVIKERLYTHSDQALNAIFPRLLKDLKRLLSVKSSVLDRLWHAERKRPKAIAPAARDTYVRRGLSKLMIFEDRATAIKLYRSEHIAAESIPAYAYSLGLAGKTIRGAVPTDPEIRSAVLMLSDEQLRTIVEDFDQSSIYSWLVTLRNSPHLVFMGHYAISHYSELCNAAKLSSMLMELYHDPWALVSKNEVPANWPPQNVWLLEYLIEIIKVIRKKKNSFGHAQLGTMVYENNGCQNADLTSATGFGGGFGLSAWISRTVDCKFKPQLIKACASVISTLLHNVSLEVFKDQIEKTNARYIQNIVESKLCAYVGFAPLWSLIKMSVPTAQRCTVRACIAEAAASPTGAATMHVGRANKTLINWQSAHDSHTNDKKKELCGRAVGLRYHWNGASFIRRPGIAKMILVLDGTWKDEDLRALVRAGWDEIYFPDEMDRVVKAIV